MGVRGRKPGTFAPRTLAIMEHLQRHYPCQSLPLGALTEVGNKFGVTRERVRQIADRLEYGRLYHQPPQQRYCKKCGERDAETGSQLCADCSFIPVVCSNCEQVVMRRSGNLTRRPGKFFYCSNSCKYEGIAKRCDATKPQSFCERCQAITAHEFNGRCAPCRRSRDRRQYQRKVQAPA